MVIQLDPELENRLKGLSDAAGVSADELVRDAVTGYLEEFADIRSVLAQRYDDLESGREVAIPADEAWQILSARLEARRSSRR